MRKLAKALMASVDYLADESITDPTNGLEKEDYIAGAHELYGSKAAAEANALPERNAALFAGGKLAQEAKVAYFEAMIKPTRLAKKRPGRPLAAMSLEWVEVRLIVPLLCYNRNENKGEDSDGY